MTEPRDIDDGGAGVSAPNQAYVRLPSSAPPEPPVEIPRDSLERISNEPVGSGSARITWGTGGFAPGVIFGGYEIMGQIATGGMATVYLARIRDGAKAGELVAIKKIHPHLEREENFAKMFLDEARVASRIAHPNVVRARAMENLNGLCLVMDYVDGEQLRHFMQSPGTPNNRIPLPIALRIASDMLHGLHAAHELRDGAGAMLGVVHRDVSPQNVLVGRDGITRLTDFGIARARGRLAVTREGLVRGKLRYMAPEQARPQGAPPDRRADVFAAGIIIWEMLAGKRLFRGDEATVIEKLLNQPTPRPKPFDGELDPVIEAAVMLSLERDPAQRHQTALAFARALERGAAAVESIADHDAVAFFVETVIGPRTQNPVLHPEQEMGAVTDVEVMFSANRNLKRTSTRPPPPDPSSWPAPPSRTPESEVAAPESVAPESVAPESLEPMPARVSEEPIETLSLTDLAPASLPAEPPAEEPVERPTLPFHEPSHAPLPLVVRRDEVLEAPAPMSDVPKAPEPEPLPTPPQVALAAVDTSAEEAALRKQRMMVLVLVLWALVAVLGFGVWRYNKVHRPARPIATPPAQSY